MKPSIGRIVHYVLPEHSGRVGEHRAAIVTNTFGGMLANLTVFLDQSADDPAGVVGAHTMRGWSVEYDESCKPGTWHWPEREPAAPSTPGDHRIDQAAAV